MTPKGLLEICLEDEDRDVFISKLPSDVYLDKTFSAGELKDKLSDLTSYYAYYAELLATCEFVASSVEEFIDEHGSIMRTNGITPYAKTRAIKRDQDDKIRFVTEISGTCCGIMFRGRNIQYFSFVLLSVKYVRDYAKNLLNSIDKTIMVGNTVLSYEKLELKNLGIV